MQPRCFAFPFGHYGSYSLEARSILRRAGLEMFFTTELGRTEPGNSERTFSRIVVHPEDDVHSFRRKLYGGYDWVGRLRRFNYALRAACTQARARVMQVSTASGSDRVSSIAAK
jgi:hypothetical protein